MGATHGRWGFAMAQPYPPYPGAPPAKPGAGTAVVAAVLALLTGLWFLAGIFWAGFWLIPEVVIGQVADLLIGLVLLVGGILLLARKGAGRVLSVLGAVLALLALVVSTVLVEFPQLRIFFYAGGPAPFDVGSVLLRRVLLALPFVLLALFAALPATGRWIRHRAPVPYGRPPGPYPGPYPQYPPQPPPPYRQGGRPPGW
jgi:hypothetical protein